MQKGLPLSVPPKGRSQGERPFCERRGAGQAALDRDPDAVPPILRTARPVALWGGCGYRRQGFGETRLPVGHMRSSQSAHSPEYSLAQSSHSGAPQSQQFRKLRASAIL